MSKKSNGNYNGDGLNNNNSKSNNNTAPHTANDDDIRIEIVSSAYETRVLDFLRTHYYREEPLTVGSEPRQQDAADEAFTMSQVQNGTCLMALTAADSVVGAVMAGPKDCDEASHLFEEAAQTVGTKWGRTLQLLACIERDANVYERFSVKRALHAHVLGVDAALRGKAIGERLMRELMALGHDLGYPLLTADCTSVYSAQLMARLGWECVNEQRYDEYRDEFGVQVFRPPKLHQCVKTFAVRL